MSPVHVRPNLRSLSSSSSSRRKRWRFGLIHSLMFTIAIAALVTIVVVHQHAALAVGALVVKQQAHHSCERHPRFWRDDVMSATRTAYTKSAEECYKLEPKRKHLVAITTLLPDKSCPARFSTKEALERLSVSLTNVLVNNPADVVLFHTGWSDLDVAAAKSIIPGAHALSIATEHWVATKGIRAWEYVSGEDFGAGYRSMCRWYSIHMFQALDGLGYQWVIRIDDDSNFPRPIPYNLVSIMEANGAEYGYRADSTDASEVLQALPEAAKYWLVAEHMKPTWLLQFFDPPNMSGLSSEGWSGLIFYNNFFITRIGWWMQPHIQAWLYFLLDLNGFYKFRWGDAPVHTVTTGMFLPDELVLQFGFEYQHQRFHYALNQFSQQFFANVVFNTTHGTTEVMPSPPPGGGAAAPPSPPPPPGDA